MLDAESSLLRSQVKDVLPKADGFLKRLMDGLHRQKLDTCVNVVITSDHGMDNMVCNHTILLKDYLSEHTLNNTHLYNGPAARLSTQYMTDSTGIYHQLLPEHRGKYSSAVRLFSYCLCNERKPWNVTAFFYAIVDLANLSAQVFDKILLMQTFK